MSSDLQDFYSLPDEVENDSMTNYTFNIENQENIIGQELGESSISSRSGAHVPHENSHNHQVCRFKNFFDYLLVNFFLMKLIVFQF